MVADFPGGRTYFQFFARLSTLKTIGWMQSARRKNKLQLGLTPWKGHELAYVRYGAQFEHALLMNENQVRVLAQALELARHMLDCFEQTERQKQPQAGNPPADYAAYLLSPEWQEKRRAVLWHAGNRCQLCNAADTPLNIHHNNYDRVGRELPNDLIALCRPCHAKHHGKPE